MKILAIETSCDETAIAIAEFSGPKANPKLKILSNIVSSQIKIHAGFGGVVPNLAKREHQKNLPSILRQSLKNSGLAPFGPKPKVSETRQKSKIKKITKILEREPELLGGFLQKIIPLPAPEIDAIAVTYGPGLAPALWVGVNFAKALAELWDKPLIPVNHMAGHLYSALLAPNGSLLTPKFPVLALLVSGGHTELVLTRAHGKYKIIGETLDDAAGEAFDKVARILGLSYPGGPEISREADKPVPAKGDLKIKLPRPMLNSGNFNFSFSGLKTAVLYKARDLRPRYGLRRLRPVVAKEFQEAVAEVLVKKTILAAKKYKIKTLLLGGGVSANKLLRQKFSIRAAKEFPSSACRLSHIDFSGDNALMIAVAAYFAGIKKAPNKVGADANLRLG